MNLCFFLEVCHMMSFVVKKVIKAAENKGQLFNIKYRLEICNKMAEQ
jgi:hypothetical protein